MNKEEVMLNKEQIEKTFTDFGCKKTITESGKICYSKNGIYFKFNYCKELNAYVLETSESVKDTLFEDSEVYGKRFSDENTLQKLKNDLIKYYVE